MTPRPYVPTFEGMAAKRKPPIRAIIHASKLYTGAGFRKRDGRRVQDADRGVIDDGALVYEKGGKILWCGRTKDIPSRYARAPKQNLRNLQAVTAGFVDCHTHLVFAGDRSDEFARRCGGESYESIAASGGGILATVRATEAASEKDLLALASARVREASAWGTRVLEIKSGYGLAMDVELRLLRVMTRLKKAHPEMTFHRTFLGAHAVPKGVSKTEYVEEILEKVLPVVAKEKLADSCDVFVDKGYFDSEDARKILGAARKRGLHARLHADELGNTESTALGVELGALSVDHLLCVSDRSIEALAASNTVGVLLPGTAFYLKAAYAPARKLIDRGACIALATDFNPGTSMTLSLPAVMTIAALYCQMSRAEILAAVTYNAAKALGLEKSHGTLEPGYASVFTVLPFATFEETYYRFAWAPKLTAPSAKR